MTATSAPTNDVALGTVVAHPPALDRILSYGSGNFGTLAHVFRDVDVTVAVVLHNGADAH